MELNSRAMVPLPQIMRHSNQDTAHPNSLDTAHLNSLDTVHLNRTGMVHRNQDIADNQDMVNHHLFSPLLECSSNQTTTQQWWLVDNPPPQ